MTSTIDLAPILALPIHERIRIIKIILDSIAAELAPVTLSQVGKQDSASSGDEPRKTD